jgi:hypothetical protein
LSSPRRRGGSGAGIILRAQRHGRPLSSLGRSLSPASSAERRPSTPDGVYLLGSHRNPDKIVNLSIGRPSITLPRWDGLRTGTPAFPIGRAGVSRLARPAWVVSSEDPCQETDDLKALPKRGQVLQRWGHTLRGQAPPETDFESRRAVDTDAPRLRLAICSTCGVRRSPRISPRASAEGIFDGCGGADPAGRHHQGAAAVFLTSLLPVRTTGSDLRGIGSRSRNRTPRRGVGRERGHGDRSNVATVCPHPLVVPIAASRGSPSAC